MISSSSFGGKNDIKPDSVADPPVVRVVKKDLRTLAVKTNMESWG